MAKFSVRVELHGGGDYDLLHAVMHALGFRRFANAFDSHGIQEMFLLPTGSYYFIDTTGRETVATVRNKVMAVALKIDGAMAADVWVVQVMTFAMWSTTTIDDPDAYPSALMIARVREV